MIAFLGTSCWDRIIRALERRRVDSWRADHYGAPGGSAPNAAATVAALGGDSLLLSALGDDLDGDALRRAWLSHRQMKTHLHQVYHTPVSYIVIEEGLPGGRQIYTDSPRPPFSPGRGDMELLQQADIVDFYPGLFRGHEDRWYETFRHARRARSINGLEDEIAKGHTWHYLFASGEEVAPPDEDVLRALQTEVAVITRGKSGGDFWTPDEGWRSFTSPACKAVDPVGAGDGFRGAMLLGIERGLLMKEAIEIAASVGSQAAARRGGFPLALEAPPGF